MTTKEAEHQDWCKMMFNMMSENGIWRVPRSGQVFRKSNGSLICENVGFLKVEYAIAEYAQIKEEFEAAGIPVSIEVEFA